MSLALGRRGTNATGAGSRARTLLGAAPAGLVRFMGRGVAQVVIAAGCCKLTYECMPWDCRVPSDPHWRPSMHWHPRRMVTMYSTSLRSPSCSSLWERCPAPCRMAGAKLGGRLASACSDSGPCSYQMSLRACLATRWQQSLQQLSRPPVAWEAAGSQHQPACGSLSAAASPARWQRQRWRCSPAAWSHASQTVHRQQQHACKSAAASDTATDTTAHPATAEPAESPGDDLIIVRAS